MYNDPDNVVDYNDLALFNFTVGVPDNSTGSSFSVVAILKFSNYKFEVTVTNNSQECFIITPAIKTETNLSKR